MTSYRYYSNIDIEEKAAAKEKNKRLLLDILSRLKEYFYPLAAKEKKSVNNQKFLLGPGTCFMFFQKESLAAGGKTKRRKNYGIIERYNQTQGS